MEKPLHNGFCSVILIKNTTVRNEYVIRIYRIVSSLKLFAYYRIRFAKAETRYQETVLYRMLEKATFRAGKTAIVGFNRYRLQCNTVSTETTGNERATPHNIIEM